MAVGIAVAIAAIVKHAVAQFNGTVMINQQPAAEPVGKFVGIVEYSGERDNLRVVIGLERFENRQLQSCAALAIAEHLHFVDYDQSHRREQIEIANQELVEFLIDQDPEIKIAVLKIVFEFAMISRRDDNANPQPSITIGKVAEAFLGNRLQRHQEQRLAPVENRRRRREFAAEGFARRGRRTHQHAFSGENAILDHCLALHRKQIISEPLAPTGDDNFRQAV